MTIEEAKCELIAFRRLLSCKAMPRIGDVLGDYSYTVEFGFESDFFDAIDEAIKAINKLEEVTNTLSEITEILEW